MNLKSGFTPVDDDKENRQAIATYSPVTTLGDAGRALKSGANIAAGASLSALEATGRAAGLEGVEGRAGRAAERRYRAAAKDAPAVGSLEDIQSVGDVGRFTLNMSAQQIPILGQQIAGTLAGRALAPAKAARGVSGAAGGGATAIATESGLNYQAIKDETGQKRPGVAFAYGTAQGALEYVPVARLLRGRPAPAGQRQGIAEFAAKQALTEGITEAAQGRIGAAAVKEVDPTKQLFDAEGRSEVLNDAAAGAAAGLVFGAVGGTAQNIIERRQQPIENLDGPAPATATVATDATDPGQQAIAALPQLSPTPSVDPQSDIDAQRANEKAQANADEEYARREAETKRRESAFANLKANQKGLPAPDGETASSIGEDNNTLNMLAARAEELAAAGRKEEAERLQQFRDAIQALGAQSADQRAQGLERVADGNGDGEPQPRPLEALAVDIDSISDPEERRIAFAALRGILDESKNDKFRARRRQVLEAILERNGITASEARPATPPERGISPPPRALPEQIPDSPLDAPDAGPLAKAARAGRDAGSLVDPFAIQALNQTTPLATEALGPEDRARLQIDPVDYDFDGFFPPPDPDLAAGLEANGRDYPRTASEIVATHQELFNEVAGRWGEIEGLAAQLADDAQVAKIARAKNGRQRLQQMSNQIDAELQAIDENFAAYADVFGVEAARAFNEHTFEILDTPGFDAVQAHGRSVDEAFPATLQLADLLDARSSKRLDTLAPEQRELLDTTVRLIRQRQREAAAALPPSERGKGAAAISGQVADDIKPLADALGGFLRAGDGKPRTAFAEDLAARIGFFTGDADAARRTFGLEVSTDEARTSADATAERGDAESGDQQTGGGDDLRGRETTPGGSGGRDAELSVRGDDANQPVGDPNPSDNQLDGEADETQDIRGDEGPADRSGRSSDQGEGPSGNGVQQESQEGGGADPAPQDPPENQDGEPAPGDRNDVLTLDADPIGDKMDSNLLAEAEAAGMTREDVGAVVDAAIQVGDIDRATKLLREAVARKSGLFADMEKIIGGLVAADGRLRKALSGGSADKKDVQAAIKRALSNLAKDDTIGENLALLAADQSPAALAADAEFVQYLTDRAAEAKARADKAAESKKAKGEAKRKLQNTGEALRRWFDKASTSAGNKLGTAAQKVKRVEKATARADLFKGILADDATPGAQRYLAAIRDAVEPFKEHAQREMLYHAAYKGKWAAFVKNITLDAEDGGTGVDELQALAKRYIDAVREFAEAAQGAKTVDEIRDAFLQATMRNPDTFDPATTRISSSDTRIEPGQFGHLITSDKYSWSRNGAIESLGYLSGYKRAKSNEDVETQSGKAKSLRRPKLADVTRTGLADHRKGKDVTPQQFKEAFGFADVGFGNYVAAGQDQKHLNYAYDAFMDLASTLGIQPSLIGFGGRLHFTIGALGHGRHAAHYSPDQPHPNGDRVAVINITNTRGDGTVAHEWMHALDWELRRNSGNAKVLRRFVQALESKVVENVGDEVVSRFIEGSWFYPNARDNDGKIPKSDKLRMARFALENGSYSRLGKSDFYKEARALDNNASTNRYWSNDAELFARAGEAYVFDLMASKGQQSNYLVADWVADGAVGKPEYRGSPYPAGADRARFAEYFKGLFNAITFDKDNGATLSKAYVDDLYLGLREAQFDIVTDAKAGLDAAYQAYLAKQAQNNKPTLSEEEQAALDYQKRIEESQLESDAGGAAETPDGDAPLTEEQLSAIWDDVSAQHDEANQERELTSNPPGPAPQSRSTGTDEATGSSGQTSATGSSGTDASAARLASEAAKLGVEGVGEAMKGLAKLFGGPGTLRSFPAGVDPDTYAAAKPHFESALRKFQAAGRTIVDLFAMLRAEFGDGFKPYAIAFAREYNLGSNLGTKPGDDNASNATTERPDSNAGDSDGGSRPEQVGPSEKDRDADGVSEGASGRGPADVSGDNRDAADIGSSRGKSTQPDGTGRGNRKSKTPSTRRGNRADARTRRGRTYTAAPGELTRQGSWRETARRNLDALASVKKLEAEGRMATPDEQAIIAKFTGWGASELAQKIFPYKIEGSPWEAEARRAEELMSPEEIRTARRSTRNAHYTSEAVTRSMWAAAQRMGFAGGKVMEPGMGIGNFPITAPRELLLDIEYTGIEFDGGTATIAKHLVQGGNVLHADISRAKLPKDYFDLAIGNPPFADTVISDDPEYRRNRFKLHDYAIAKSIDRLRPGGIALFVTSRYTMDKGSQAFRRYVDDRADLISAARLPRQAFEANAGTEVVTDVLVFRKRHPGEARAGQAWLSMEKVEVDGAPQLVNEYFAANPGNVLGTASLSGSMYRGNEYTVDLPGDKLQQRLDKWVAELPENITAPPSNEQVVNETFSRDFDPTNKKIGGLYLADGKVLSNESGSGVPVESITERPLSKADLAWLTDYVHLRDAVKQAQMDQWNDGEWQKSLAALNRRYKAFVKKHGNILEHKDRSRTTKKKDGTESVSQWRQFKRDRLLQLDVESPLVEQLESISEDGTIKPGRFLSGRSIAKPVPPPVETVNDALMVSLDAVGDLDIDDVARRAKKSAEEVIRELGSAIYQTPAGQWQMADKYLSGNVVEKLDDAEAAAKLDPRFQRNVDALIKVIPRPLQPKDIDAELGAGWVDAKYVEQFAREHGFETSVTYDPAIHAWSVERASGTGARGARGAHEYGTKDRSPYEIMQAALDGTPITIRRSEKVDGKTVTWVDAEATAAVQEKYTAMQSRFSQWLWEDSSRASALAATYNRQYNNIAPRRFDGSHLSLPGLSLRYQLYDHQKRAIWRMIQTGNTYLAHAVGAGKTLEMIVGGMEQKRLGLISKPMYVVPNHLLKQFAADFLDAYPTANLAVADKDNFNPRNRERFAAQVAMNAPDAVIITKSAFKLIEVSEKSRADIVNRFIADLEAAIEDSKDDRFRRKALEAQKERIERKFSAKSSSEGSGKKSKTLTFEELGVDYLLVDEAHEYRKLDFVTRRENLKGIDPNGSQQALDLFIKVRHLESQRPGRSVTLASGTPVVNTMAELYSVQRFMDLDSMEADGLSNFDAWSGMFGRSKVGLEQDAAGNYVFVERYARFVNMNELGSRVRQFMDVLTSNQLRELFKDSDRVNYPDLDGGKPNLKIVHASPALGEYLATELNARIEASKRWKPTADEPHNKDPMINIITDGRLAAIDLRFVTNAKDDPKSKLEEMLRSIIEMDKEASGIRFVDPETKQQELIPGGTQIVFSPVGFGATVAANRGFDVKALIKQRLTAGGFKADQIAFMDEHKTDAKKAQLFKRMRQGRVKVLFGSPANMGTGVNVQKRLKHLHFLSPPWYPADVEQPHGRILRQGNQNESVGITWYAAKGTYDSTGWQMVSRKAQFIEQFFLGDASVRQLDDTSESSQYEMAAALSSGDERAIRLAGLKADVERLTRLDGAHYKEQQEIRRELKSIDWKIDGARTRIERSQAAINQLGERKKLADLTLVIDGKVVDEKIDTVVSQALSGWAKQFKQGDFGERLTEVKETDLGTFDGRPVKASLSLQKAFLSNEKPQPVFELHVDHVKGYQVRVGEPVWAADLGSVGWSARLTNARNRPFEELQESTERLEQLGKEKARLESRVGQPFEYADELAEKQAEAAKLESELGTTSDGDTSDPEANIMETRGGNAEWGAPWMTRAAELGPGGNGEPAQASADAKRLLGFDLGVPFDDIPSRQRQDDVPARYNQETRRIEINPAVFSRLTRQEAAAAIVEEYLHALDVGIGQSLSAAATDFRPGGAVRSEAMAAMEQDEKIFNFLRYPMLDPSLTEDRVSAELFARLGALYYLDPKQFKRNFPHAEQTFAVLSEKAGVGAPDPRRLPDAIRWSARLVHQAGSERRDGRSLVGRYAKGPADWHAHRGVQQLRASLASILGAGIGRRVGGSLDTRIPTAPSLGMGYGADNGTVRQIRDKIGDHLHNQRTFNRWWDRTVGTQFHKATKDKDFKRVFDAGQDFLADVSLYANDASDQAPDILPKYESIRDVTNFGITNKDQKAVAAAVYHGTLVDQRVYTDAELRSSKFKLNPRQIRLYRQFRGAVDRSLTDLGITVIKRMAEAEGLNVQRDEVRQQRDIMSWAAKIGAELEAQGKADAANAVMERSQRIEGLKAEGYAPLMRFGRYTVRVVNESDETVFFSMYESQSEANRAARSLRDEYSGMTVTQGVMSQDAWKQFRGVSPDTLQLFGEELGLGDNEVFQQYIRLATSNRSTMRRLLQRKGIAGFSEDVPRSLASFVTSNARAASMNLNGKEMADSVQAIPKSKGDVIDEAVRLHDFLTEPREEAAALRGYLFFNYLGGSVASAAVNMTQSLTMTLPYLAQHGGPAKASADILSSVKQAGNPDAIADRGLRDALKQAEREGVVAPHEIHQLYAESIQRAKFPFAPQFNRLTRGVLRGWGSLFAYAEQINRRIAFISAMKTAARLGSRGLAEAGFDSAYDFAVQAVHETQGIYNKGNRPNWARGAVGATVFTFKQFSISYMELLARLPAREKLLALGVLAMSAGVQGLPFAEDIEDILDTIAESLGYDWQSKAAMDRAIASVFGQGVGSFVSYGFSALPGLPLDVQLRMGMGNLIPGTSLGLKSKPNKGSEILEVVGPAGSSLESFGEAFSKVQSGKLGDAALTIAPVAVQNAAKGVLMASRGYYADSRGRRVIDTTAADAAVKSIGFQPSRVAEESRNVGGIYQRNALLRVTESEIADLWARGVVEKDPRKVERARKRLREWNRQNPQSRIRIKPIQIRARVKAIRSDRMQRLRKATPPEIRKQVSG